MPVPAPASEPRWGSGRKAEKKGVRSARACAAKVNVDWTVPRNWFAAPRSSRSKRAVCNWASCLSILACHMRRRIHAFYMRRRIQFEV
jgi:hypothetical protein